MKGSLLLPPTPLTQSVLAGLSWDGYSVQEAEMGQTGMYVWVSRKVLSLVPDGSSAHPEDFARFHKTQGTVRGLRLLRRTGRASRCFFAIRFLSVPVSSIKAPLQTMRGKLCAPSLSPGLSSGLSLSDSAANSTYHLSWPSILSSPGLNFPMCTRQCGMTDQH